jgi:hypothetical protein
LTGAILIDIFSLASETVILASLKLSTWEAADLQLWRLGHCDWEAFHASAGANPPGKSG